MVYELGNAELDATIASLVAQSSNNGSADLISEIITTALKLHRDDPERGELKLINTALKEMRYSNLVFSNHRDTPKVTMYGSARTPADNADYIVAKRFAEIMVNHAAGMSSPGPAQESWPPATKAPDSTLASASTYVCRSKPRPTSSWTQTRSSTSSTSSPASWVS